MGRKGYGHITLLSSGPENINKQVTDDLRGPDCS